jgi:LysM repeat protein
VTIVPAFVAFALTPQDARVVTSVQGWNGCAYRVRHHDNLFRIGIRYGVTYHYLAQINGIYNPNYIYAGQVISVPCGPLEYKDYEPYYPKHRPARVKYPPYQCPWCQPFLKPENCGNTVQYTVQPGDNLFRIAVNNGSTIQWIRTDNGLWGKVLRPGLILEVPCQGYVTYPPIPPYTVIPTGGIITATPLPTIIPQDRIRMRDGQFRPAQRTVSAGTTVTWLNNEDPGGPVYTVTSGQPGQPNGLFSSGNILPGGTYNFTFTTPGNYSYFSTTDPNMTGEIIVEP